MRPGVYVQLGPGADLHLFADRMLQVHGPAVSALALNSPTGERAFEVTFGSSTPPAVELPIGVYALHLQIRVPPRPS